MQQREIEHILFSVKAPLDHPLFYPRVFALSVKEQKKVGSLNPLFSLIDEEYEELSRRLDRSFVQLGCSVRNVLRTRALAKSLIDEKGEVKTVLLRDLIIHLKSHLYSLGVQRHLDGKCDAHILHVLQLLESDASFVRLIKKVSRPPPNSWGENLIRQTLQIDSKTVITDVHAQQAVLAAWLCTLRQNVGSCFATAPAIIVHDEQPELFLQDLCDIISTGMLKRTFGGVEHSVPLSASFGSGDLKKPLLFQTSSRGITPEIWYSPGLMKALEAVGLLKTQTLLKEKIDQIKGWILPLIHQNPSSSFWVLTVEEILKKILLQSFGLTEKQVNEYKKHSKQILQTQFVIPSASSFKKNERVVSRCAHFLNSFEIAKNVFKSFSDNALLKAWEFTLASFSETKYEFSQWNLYASLGMTTNEPGGIGQYIYQVIQEKLNEANEKTAAIQYEYEMVYTRVKTLESKMNHAASEKEMQWLRVDYQAAKSEFYFLEERRDNAQRGAKALVNLYDNLHHHYVELFKEYFQEVYDADMQEVTTSPFDDSPAGFRLLYKHGRSNTSLWTLIYSPEEFIDALSSFFVATEPHIAHLQEEDKIEKDLSEIVTGIINHVKTKEFLETAFHRMAIAHGVSPIKNPLDHLEQIEKKPWVYTSGGRMNTLVSCYYRIEGKPKEVEKWVESEIELLVYLADTLKQIPHKLLEPYFKGQRKSMLMTSPTHAFLLQPATSPFTEMWTNEAFTYTFIRDHFVIPAEDYVERILLNDEMISYLLQKLEEKVPVNFQPRFRECFRNLKGPLSPIFFREHLVEELEKDKGLRPVSLQFLSRETIDSLLYSTLPLFPVHELRGRVEKILSLLPSLTRADVMAILALFDTIPLTKGGQLVMGSMQLQEICKALLCLFEKETRVAYDAHAEIQKISQDLGFSIPSPLIFADTNWVKDLFGFIVSPGTGKLELWRFDRSNLTGYPMTSWKKWMDGSAPNKPWQVYVRPYEYGQN